MLFSFYPIILVLSSDSFITSHENSYAHLIMTSVLYLTFSPLELCLFSSYSFRSLLELKYTLHVLLLPPSLFVILTSYSQSGSQNDEAVSSNSFVLCLMVVCCASFFSSLLIDWSLLYSLSYLFSPVMVFSPWKNGHLLFSSPVFLLFSSHFPDPPRLFFSFTPLIYSFSSRLP